jgi:hypothetical protein
MLTKHDLGYYSGISLKGLRHAAKKKTHIHDNLSLGTRDIFPSMSNTVRKDLRKSHGRFDVFNFTSACHKYSFLNLEKLHILSYL